MKLVHIRNNEMNKVPGLRYTKFKINVYSLLDSYAIDLKLVYGEILYFMDLCAIFYQRLVLSK